MIGPLVARRRQTSGLPVLLSEPSLPLSLREGFVAVFRSQKDVRLRNWLVLLLVFFPLWFFRCVFPLRGYQRVFYPVQTFPHFIIFDLTASRMVMETGVHRFAGYLAFRLANAKFLPRSSSFVNF